MMNKITTILRNFVKSLTKELPQKLAAVLFAIVTWFYVASSVNTNMTDTIRNVPVNLTLAGTNAEKNNLSIVNIDTEYVNVDIEGSRTQIGSLQRDDLIVTLDAENITEAGTYELGFKVTSKTNKAFEYKVRPTTVKVVMDKLITRTFDVTAEAPNASTAEGYMRDKLICTPNIIKISGPAEQVEKITKCVVKTDLNETLSESKMVTSSDLQLYSGNSLMQLDEMDLQLGQTDFTIEIPIYMKKVLPFNIPIQVPSGFPRDQLKYTLDVSTIEVAAPNSILENIDAIPLDKVNLRDLDIGKTIELPVTLPDGFKNLSGIDKVRLTLDGTGLETKTMNIKLKGALSIIYDLPQYNITPLTQGFSNVKFIGTKEAIEKLTASDVVVLLDMSNISTEVFDSSFTEPVTIYVPGGDLVWAVGSYQALFRAEQNQ